MKRGLAWIALTCLIVTSLILASCTTTSTTTTTTLSTPAVTTTSKTTTALVTTSTTKPAATTTSTAVTSNWWDKLGKPQYGGEISLRTTSNITNFDPYFASQLANIMGGWMETLFEPDWTLDPAVFDYKLTILDPKFVKGRLAESWEFSDQSSLVVHVRQGIHWQNLPPVNGREFTAADVVYHYGRLYGIGAGFTKPSPYVASTTMTSVASTDKYTVVFKFNVANAAQNLITIQGVSSTQCMEASDVVNQWGDANDWHHAVGTGPFILSDVVSSGSATMVKNPAYWGYDERYPQNKLPYADSLKVLVIPDNATALAAVRTGKIDLIDSISSATALLLQKSNPSILQVPVPANSATTIDPRNDLAPYKDIRVREALQMSIDLPSLAANYYNNQVSPYPSSLTSIYQNGGGFPYTAWPQDLKDTYTYNPTAAKKLLAEAGFPGGFKTNIVVDSAADQDLLQAVKAYFFAIGVDMEIRPMDTSSWASFVMTNHKQDALAQRTTGTLGQTQTAVAQLNRFRTGVVYNYIGVSDPTIDGFYNNGLAATNPDDLTKILESANEYIARQHLTISLLTVNSFSLCQPWVKGFNAQAQSTGSTPVNLSFYEARYWVDQGLKKASGH
jgi:peptide/nickel transport system substrate-binding protein